ncbi:sugar phosphate isomerase/epimerase family protein [Cohnella hashimotonis]|uniref:TIM barrel protein n=1 Tax=Cohnella hashimotonis TaxID=2826895 RepID=A0ABT6TIG4_9BACL|nr:TIM barrel protein [Cohnella hashimotonis]MDI4646622.1 TIM barrel protein [Cohnella hashimotonis]
MLFTGLVSVTFRSLSPEEIVSLAAQAGLDGIEWGGDVHVPPGDLRLAGQVRAMTESAGLQVSSYGSYYRVGDDNNFSLVLDSADALGAPAIRIWAGSVGSAEADDDSRRRIVEEIQRMAELSQQRGIGLSLEFHDGTLADTEVSAVSLIRSIASNNVKLYWQPQPEVSPQRNLTTLTAFLPWLSNVHVFHYDERRRQQPLKVGNTAWQSYTDVLRSTDKPRYLLLEFVKDGEIGQFLEDASVLKNIVRQVREDESGF